jgi:hypothetical protein
MFIYACNNIILFMAALITITDRGEGGRCRITHVIYERYMCI